MKKPIIGISASMIYEEKDELFLGDKIKPSNNFTCSLIAETSFKIGSVTGIPPDLYTAST